jgi:hypothetical protein
MNYPPRRDGWITAIVLIDSLLLIVAALGIFLVLLSDGLQNHPWPLPPIFLAVAVLLLWMYLATSYEITPTELKVRCGPLHKTIPLERIAGAIATRKLFGSLEVSFAWSAHRVRIQYCKANGRPALFMLVIAPRDRERFLADLAAATGLQPAEDGWLRRPLEKPKEPRPL